MTDDIDLDELREKAEAAREPNDWHIGEDHVEWREHEGEVSLLKSLPITTIRAGVGEGSHEILGSDGVHYVSDAEFIAALDPQTVLALVDRVERLEVYLDCLTRGLSEAEARGTAFQETHDD